METLLNVQELSEKLRVNKTWIYERTRKDKIPHYKLGRYCLFNIKEIEEYLNTLHRGDLDA